MIVVLPMTIVFPVLVLPVLVPPRLACVQRGMALEELLLLPGELRPLPNEVRPPDDDAGLTDNEARLAYDDARIADDESRARDDDARPAADDDLRAVVELVAMVVGPVPLPAVGLMGPMRLLALPFDDVGAGRLGCGEAGTKHQRHRQRGKAQGAQTRKLCEHGCRPSIGPGRRRRDVDYTTNKAGAMQLPARAGTHCGEAPPGRGSAQ